MLLNCNTTTLLCVTAGSTTPNQDQGSAALAAADASLQVVSGDSRSLESVPSCVSLWRSPAPSDNFSVYPSLPGSGWLDREVCDVLRRLWRSIVQGRYLQSETGNSSIQGTPRLRGHFNRDMRSRQFTLTEAGGLSDLARRSHSSLFRSHEAWAAGEFNI